MLSDALYGLSLSYQAIPAIPKELADTRAQFEQLLSLLEIPSTCSSKEKLARLRAVSADELMAVVMKLDLYTFRPCNDGAFFRECRKRLS